MSDTPIEDLLEAMNQIRNAPPIGMADNPYVLFVPSWFETLCAKQGTTPQEVYNKTYAGSSFRHGRVEVVK